jgi:AraC-like DNA-binding protein
MNQDIDRRVRIIAELLRKQESLPIDNSHAIDNRLWANPDEYLTIDDLAERVGISPVHLRDLFRRGMKMTIRQFTKLLRMWNAIRLAEEDPGLPISKIVERVRGGDESHFQRDFKKAFGVTFGEFRRCQSEESR